MNPLFHVPSKRIYKLLKDLDPKPALKKRLKLRAMKNFYGQFIKEGDLCFDIGANLGNRVNIFLALGAKVIALEPQPHCIEELSRVYLHNSNVTVVPQAVGEHEGEQEMHISNANTISTMSNEWLTAVKESGRFKEFSWEQKIKVKTTTLDSLIKRFGNPAFIKIDVEGYEEKVIRGLTSKVQTMSFEFSPECCDSTIRCIQYLSNLGSCMFNISYGETMKYSFPQWLNASEMIEQINGLRNKFEMCGDIYLKYAKTQKRNRVAQAIF